jgi:hypothetical protein
MVSTEDELQRAVYALNNIATTYNSKISVYKTKAMTMKGKMNVRTKVVINNHIIEHVNSFSCLRYAITVTNNRGFLIKIIRFTQT